MDPKPKMGCSPNGPYYLLNDMEVRPVPNLRRASGEACANVRAVALCRCGASKNKPFCDGTHSVIGFKDAKTADPAKDKRQAYEGKASASRSSTIARSARTRGSAPTS